MLERVDQALAQSARADEQEPLVELRAPQDPVKQGRARSRGRRTPRSTSESGAPRSAKAAVRGNRGFRSMPQNSIRVTEVSTIRIAQPADPRKRAARSKRELETRKSYSSLNAIAICARTETMKAEIHACQMASSSCSGSLAWASSASSNPDLDPQEVRRHPQPDHQRQQDGLAGDHGAPYGREGSGEGRGASALSLASMREGGGRGGERGDWGERADRTHRFLPRVE